jgi:hypothetical protein
MSSLLLVPCMLVQAAMAKKSVTNNSILCVMRLCNILASYCVVL